MLMRESVWRISCFSAANMVVFNMYKFFLGIIIYNIIVIMCQSLYSCKDKSHSFQLFDVCSAAFHGIDSGGGDIDMSQQICQLR